MMATLTNRGGEKHLDIGCILIWPVTEGKKYFKKASNIYEFENSSIVKIPIFPNWSIDTVQPQEILNWQTKSEC